MQQDERTWMFQERRQTAPEILRGSRLGQHHYHPAETLQLRQDVRHRQLKNADMTKAPSFPRQILPNSMAHRDKIVQILQLTIAFLLCVN